MKKSLFFSLLAGLFLSACLPAFLQPETTAPTSIPEENLRETAAVLSQLTLQALPTLTTAPSNTPVVMTATRTIISSETLTPGSGTTATLTQTATPTSPTGTARPSASPTVTRTLTPTLTPAGFIPTSTETPHPLFYGTLPPNLPSGKIVLINKSKTEVYISLQCTTQDGYNTILEYPVPKRVNTRGPAGKYTYVAWVGGVQMVGHFGLGKQGEVVITIYKDRIEVK